HTRFSRDWSSDVCSSDLAFDIADRPSDLGDDDIDIALRADPLDPRFDLVRYVGDHLDGVTEIVAPTLLLDHRQIHRPGSDVGGASQVLTGESLVVAEVEVGLTPVVGDELLAVLERVHGAWIDVDVRVELLVDDPQTP